MLTLLAQFIPAQTPSWEVLFIIVVVLALDLAVVVVAISIGVLFIAFKAGKAAYDAVDRLVDWLISTAFRLAEDLLETPPLDKVQFFQLVLVGVKTAYDIVNGAQKLMEFAVNLAVTALAAAVVLLCVLALALLNLAALEAIVYCLK